MVEDLPSQAPDAPSAGPAGDESKRLRKEARLQAAQARPLDPWERYRSLVDTLEEAMDLVELADRKARFALVIMGALNVAFFFLMTRSELVDVLPARLRPFAGVYLLVYAAVALYFFLQAIEALKPRTFHPQLHYPGEAGAEHFPEGLRFHEDIVQRDVDAYRRAWREVRFGQLNAELAVQNHVMARINNDKYRSLRRLYGGLRVLALLAGGLLAVLALSMLATRPSVPAQASEASAPAASTVFAPPVKVPAPGLGEASGIVWHPALGRFFAVGDRGTLAELDASGRLLALHHVKGNLEDVAVHTPSGRLVLLAEKKGELVVWDPAAAAETARFRLDVAAVLAREPAERNQGFEGLAFRADADLPAGGSFFLVHQRRPARLVELAFDPTGPVRTLGAGDVLARHALKPFEDLTAVTWCERLNRLLVVAESDDRLLAVTVAGTISASWALPGVRQEGVAVGPEGALWIADERLGLVRVPGALDALATSPASGS